MINILLHIALLVGLVACLVQDVKYRGIHFMLFPSILIITLFLNYRMDWGWTDVVLSASFVSVIILVLFIYVSLKQKQLVNIFKSYLGLGDVLFFVVATPLFSFRNYMIYFISGMIFSIVFHLLFNRFQNHKTIPLAGYMSFYAIGLVAYTFVDPSFLKMDIL